MHGDHKTFPPKPTKICAMHRDDKKFPLKQSTFVKCMVTTKRFQRNQL